MLPICYNACIMVDATFKMAKQPGNSIFVPVHENIGRISEQMLIGCLISETEMYIKNSRHCNIVVAKMGNHYYYLLHFLPKKNNTHCDLRVGYIRNAKVITVVIPDVHCTRVGVGTKVANSFGQKNICSMLNHLSDCWDITRDGYKVHAHIVHSDVSIIGRIASSHL